MRTDDELKRALNDCEESAGWQERKILLEVLLDIRRSQNTDMMAAADAEGYDRGRKHVQTEYATIAGRSAEVAVAFGSAASGDIAWSFYRGREDAFRFIERLLKDNSIGECRMSVPEDVRARAGAVTAAAVKPHGESVHSGCDCPDGMSSNHLSTCVVSGLR